MRLIGIPATNYLRESILPAPSTTPATSWFGNSFPGLNGSHVQNDFGAIAVSSSGLIYYNSFYDEGGYESGIYNGNALIGVLADLNGWGHGGGYAVAFDSTYAYVGITQKAVMMDRQPIMPMEFLLIPLAVRLVGRSPLFDKSEKELKFFIFE